MRCESFISFTVHIFILYDILLRYHTNIGVTLTIYYFVYNKYTNIFEDISDKGNSDYSEQRITLVNVQRSDIIKDEQYEH